jgi:hypothetical protein
MLCLESMRQAEDRENLCQRQRFERERELGEDDRICRVIGRVEQFLYPLRILIFASSGLAVCLFPDRPLSSSD